MISVLSRNFDIVHNIFTTFTIETCLNPVDGVIFLTLRFVSSCLSTLLTFRWQLFWVLLHFLWVLSLGGAAFVFWLNQSPLVVKSIFGVGLCVVVWHFLLLNTTKFLRDELSALAGLWLEAATLLTLMEGEWQPVRIPFLLEKLNVNFFKSHREPPKVKNTQINVGVTSSIFSSFLEGIKYWRYARVFHYTSIQLTHCTDHRKI